ncbi:hypothetical protein KQI84_12790 [bacterium]|nr:hypothetical protein [bacterium]
MGVHEQSHLVISGIEYPLLSILGKGPLHTSYLIEEPTDGKLVIRVYHSRFSKEIESEYQEATGRGMQFGQGVEGIASHGWIDGQFYVARRFTSGTSFNEFASTNQFRPKKLKDAITLGRLLCAEVQKIHDADLVHGHITPWNIFFTGAAVAQIHDGILGIVTAKRLAKAANPMPSKAAMLLAPEQRKQDEVVSKQTDVYLIGAALCRLYTGIPDLKIDEMVLRRLVQAKLPIDLVKVLFHAIQQEPSHRFPDIQTFSQALQELEMPESKRLVQVRPLPVRKTRALDMLSSKLIAVFAALVIIAGIFTAARYFVNPGKTYETHEKSDASRVAAGEGSGSTSDGRRLGSAAFVNADAIRFDDEGNFFYPPQATEGGEILFRAYVPLAEEVRVVGDFNSWETESADSLMEPLGYFRFQKSVKLDDGDYQFKYWYRWPNDGEGDTAVGWYMPHEDLAGRVELGWGPTNAILNIRDGAVLSRGAPTGDEELLFHIDKIPMLVADGYAVYGPDWPMNWRLIRERGLQYTGYDGAGWYWRSLPLSEDGGSQKGVRYSVGVLDGDFEFYANGMFIGGRAYLGPQTTEEIGQAKGPVFDLPTDAIEHGRDAGRIDILIRLNSPLGIGGFILYNHIWNAPGVEIDAARLEAAHKNPPGLILGDSEEVIPLDRWWLFTFGEDKPDSPPITFFGVDD